MEKQEPIVITNNAKWIQKTIHLPKHKRGFHLITKDILKEIKTELSQINIGLANFFSNNFRYNFPSHAYIRQFDDK